MADKIKFTEKRLRELQPVEGKQVEFWDTELSCFGVRVSPGGTKTFLISTMIQKSVTMPQFSYLFGLKHTPA